MEPSPQSPGIPPFPTNRRASRLLSTALETPEPRQEEWAASLWRPPSSAELQAWLDDYEITGRFARGSSGAVYAGRHRLLSKPAALKVLPPAPGFAPANTDRFLTEGRLLASLSHPHILRVLDSRPLPHGQHLLIFDYAEGGNLRQRLAANPPTFTEVLTLAARIADGLAHAHTRGIIHRDLKPENILFDATRTPLIADFGSAMFSAPGTESLTSSNTGTPDYLAPEQALGYPPQPAADLYSFGVMLHELLTGHLPATPATPDQAAVINPAVPGTVRPLLIRLLGSLATRQGLTAAATAESLAALLTTPRPPRSRLRYLFPAAALILLAWAVSKPGPPPETSTGKLTANPTPPPAATRAAVLDSLTRFRKLESAGAWPESHAAYGAQAEYFDQGPLRHPEIIRERETFAARRQAFRSVRMETPVFLPSTPQEIRMEVLSWCEIPHLGQPTTTLGFASEQLTWTPASPGTAWPWQISHHNSHGSSYWSTPRDPVLTDSAATVFVDAFLKAEAADDRPAQIKAFASRCLYYGTGWKDHPALLQAIGKRQEKRPTFHCTRTGPVTVERGTLSRWTLTFPAFSMPRRPGSTAPGHPTPEPRVFLLAPGPGGPWLILAEASGIAGLPELERFFRAQP